MLIAEHLQREVDFTFNGIICPTAHIGQVFATS